MILFPRNYCFRQILILHNRLINQEIDYIFRNAYHMRMRDNLKIFTGNGRDGAEELEQKCISLFDQRRGMFISWMVECLLCLSCPYNCLRFVDQKAKEKSIGVARLLCLCNILSKK